MVLVFIMCFRLGVVLGGSKRDLVIMGRMLEGVGDVELGERGIGV